MPDWNSIELPPQPNTWVGCGCLDAIVYVLVRFNKDGSHQSTTLRCETCGDARVMRKPIIFTSAIDRDRLP